MAFGLFSEAGPILFTVVTLSLIILFFIANHSHHLDIPSRFALSLILGGALGNWIDRFRYQAVIDFIDLKVWPVFNIADSAITVGVLLYLFILFKSRKKL